MEIVVLLVAVLALSVYVLVRRDRTAVSDEARRYELAHDLRDKNTGQNSLPNGGRPSTNPPLGTGGNALRGGTGGGGGGGGGGGF